MRFLRTLGLISLIVGVLSACGSTNTKKLGVDLNSVKVIQINDSWIGNGVSREAIYTLERQNDQFRGEVSYNYKGVDAKKGTAPVSLTLEQVQTMLDKLAQSPLSDGPYKYQSMMADNYPSMQITLQLADQTMIWFSSSIEKNRVPWGVRINGVEYMINSPIPNDALEPILSELEQAIPK